MPLGVFKFLEVVTNQFHSSIINLVKLKISSGKTVQIASMNDLMREIVGFSSIKPDYYKFQNLHEIEKNTFI